MTERQTVPRRWARGQVQPAAAAALRQPSALEEVKRYTLLARFLFNLALAVLARMESSMSFMSGKES